MDPRVKPEGDGWRLVLTDKGTEISISKGGLSFKTDGEASQRLANAVLDFLSPLTEGAGFLGTKLRGYRMESALNATLRAKKICDDNNLSINPVPPKFLLQWVEGASMEDIESTDNLSELWANLLVSESEGGNPNSLIYMDMLKKLNTDHVQFLSLLLGNSYPSAVGNPAIAFGKYSIESLLAEPFNTDNTDEISVLTKIPSEELLKQIDLVNDMPGVDLLAVSAMNSGIFSQLETENFWFEWIPEDHADCEGDRPDLIFSSLAALELVDRVSGKVSVMDKLELRYIASIFTPLGWDFLRACKIKEAK